MRAPAKMKAPTTPHQASQASRAPRAPLQMRRQARPRSAVVVGAARRVTGLVLPVVAADGRPAEGATAEASDASPATEGAEKARRERGLCEGRAGQRQRQAQEAQGAALRKRTPARAHRVSHRRRSLRQGHERHRSRDHGRFLGQGAGHLRSSRIGGRRPGARSGRPLRRARARRRFARRARRAHAQAVARRRSEACARGREQERRDRRGLRHRHHQGRHRGRRRRSPRVRARRRTSICAPAPISRTSSASGSTFAVTQYAKRGRDVVVSRRAMLETEAKEKREEALKNIEIGRGRQGRRPQGRCRSARSSPSSAGDVEGLVRMTESSHNRAAKLEGRLQARREIEGQDPARRRARASSGSRARRPSSDPVEARSRRSTRRARATRARSLRLQPFGAFIELEPGIDGLHPHRRSLVQAHRAPQEVVKAARRSTSSSPTSMRGSHKHRACTPRPRRARRTSRGSASSRTRP